MTETDNDDHPVARALIAHVSLLAAAGGDMPLARLMLARGKSYSGTRYVGMRMTPKMCFKNAIRLAERKGYRYAEGYALSGTLLTSGIVFPVEHAWCVDRDGNAVDPTWEDPENSHYLGIEFDVTEVWKRTALTGTFGMFFKGVAGTVDHDFLETLMPDLKPGEVDPNFLPDGEGLLPRPS